MSSAVCRRVFVDAMLGCRAISSFGPIVDLTQRSQRLCSDLHPIAVCFPRCFTRCFHCGPRLGVSPRPVGLPRPFRAHLAMPSLQPLCSCQYCTAFSSPSFHACFRPRLVEGGLLIAYLDDDPDHSFDVMFERCNRFRSLPSRKLVLQLFQNLRGPNSFQCFTDF